jgi:hypothetical protein
MLGHEKGQSKSNCPFYHISLIILLEYLFQLEYVRYFI